MIPSQCQQYIHLSKACSDASLEQIPHDQKKLLTLTQAPKLVVNIAYIIIVP